MAKSVFDQIKKQNGEAFAKAIRNNDNGIFDVPNIVDIVKYAGREAEPILAYLVSLKKITIEEHGVYKDPITLLDEVGYDAYYVNTLEEQNAIEKYFEPNERLCTFRDPSRFERFHIINAVRKDVDEIRREDFVGKEQREDKYGTSVISIQILKTGGFISIKNRYNHTVDNPDNTLDSNPDNIIQGLAAALKHHYRVDFSSQTVLLPRGFTLFGDQIIKYNYEDENIYYGSDFYVKDGVVHSLNKDKEIFIGNCIFCNEKGRRTLFDPRICEEPILIDEVPKYRKDLIGVLAKELRGKEKVVISKDKSGIYSVVADDETIAKVDNQGNLTELNLPTVTKIGGDVLVFADHLTKFNAPKLKHMGSCVLWRVPSLTEFNAPELTDMGKHALAGASSLTEFNAPELKYMGQFALQKASSLAKFNAPKLKHMGDWVLQYASSLTKFNAPELTKMGDYTLQNASTLTEFNAPLLSEKEDLPYHIQDLLRDNEASKSDLAEAEIAPIDQETPLTSGTPSAKAEDVSETDKKTPTNTTLKKTLEESGGKLVISIVAFFKGLLKIK